MTQRARSDTRLRGFLSALNVGCGVAVGLAAAHGLMWLLGLACWVDGIAFAAFLGLELR